MENLNQALNINPNLVLAYLNRGAALDDSGDVKGAIEDYNQALRLNSNLTEAYVNRGLALAKSGDRKGAITDLKKASQLIQQQGKIAEYQYVIKLFPKINNR
jgi:tetratricopeptide (TPR) repeat protein